MSPTPVPNRKPSRDALSKDNVVMRLKQRLKEARGFGFQVRMEMLDGEQASWCEIAGVPMLFVDLSQTAAEQLQQVEETLRAHAALQSTLQSTDQSHHPRQQSTSTGDDDLAKRAA